MDYRAHHDVDSKIMELDKRVSLIEHVLANMERTQHTQTMLQVGILISVLGYLAINFFESFR